MKNVLVLTVFFPLFLSCDILGNNTSTFLNEDSYIKNKEKWQGFNLENYSFDLVFDFPASSMAYVVGVEIENSNLKKRVYKVIFCEDVSTFSDDEIQAKIDEVKNRKYSSYDESVDKLCIELSNMNDVYNLVDKIYSDGYREYENDKHKYQLKTSIIYDKSFAYPKEFSCGVYNKYLLGWTGQGSYGVTIKNFKVINK